MNPASLKASLLAALGTIEGLEAQPSPVAGGTALVYRGKEFAHFHHDTEIDLRLTRSVIKDLGLVHPADSKHHPGRSPSSPWIELRFANEQEVAVVVLRVKAAIAML